MRNASRQRPEVSGGELFLLPRGFFALLAQGLTNLMASLSPFLGEHGRVFTSGPAPENPPKRDLVVKVLQFYSLTGHEKRK